MTDLKVADTWYRTRRVDDDLTLIWEPHVDPLLRCNIWHVRGRDKDLLVDTGLGMQPLRPAIAHLVDKPLAAVATHIHYDHVGAMHEFEERLIHGAEAAALADYRDFASLRVSDFGDSLREYFEAREDLGDLLIDALPSGEFDLDNFGIRSAMPTAELAEGGILDLGDRSFEVLHLPGHSPGSIGLWEAASGVLFSGDAIYDGPLLDDIEGADIPDYVATMKRLRELPVRVVHGGHDASFGRERMIEICDDYLALRG